MRRRVFTLLSALTLVLCLATCVLWALSYIHDGSGLHLYWRHNGHYTLGADAGRIRYGWRLELRPPPEATTMQWARSRPISRWQWLGIDYANGEEVYYVDMFSEGRSSFVHDYGRTRYIAVPAWMIVGLTILPPAVWLRRRLKVLRDARRIRRNCCPICGYDLRATPRRCPECGTVPAGRGKA